MDSPCDDPDVCRDGEANVGPCGLNGRGRSTGECVDGQWVGELGCHDTDVCVDGDTDVRACGLDDAGEASRPCVRGQWDPAGPCSVGQCAEGVIEERACGFVDLGLATVACRDGVEVVECDDAGLCDALSQREMCPDGTSYRVRSCRLGDLDELRGQWGDWGECRAGACPPGDAECARCTDPYEGNDSIATGTYAAVGSRTDLKLCATADSTDVDYFLTSSGNTTYLFTATARFDAPADPPPLVINGGIDRNGRWPSTPSVDDGGVQRVQYITPGGLYQPISVEPLVEGVIAYDLTLEAEPFPFCPEGPPSDGCYACDDAYENNDWFNSATVVNPGTRIAAGLCAVRDRADYFRFDTGPGATLRLDFAVLEQTIGERLDIVLYDADRAQRPFDLDGGALTYDVGPTGVAYLRLSVQGGAMNYRFDAEVVGGDGR